MAAKKQKNLLGKKQKRLFMLDTNVLLIDSRALFSFEEATIGIPAAVLEELDEFKKEASDRGRSARAIIRHLDQLREQGSLHDGVKLENGSIVKIFFLREEPAILPFRVHTEDNEILLTTLAAQGEGYEATFVSKDLNARVKADALGLQSEDYSEEHVSQEDFYRGWIKIPVPAVQLTSNAPKVLETITQTYDISPNEYVLLESQHNAHNYRVFRYVGEKKFKPVSDPHFRWPLHARNPQQLMALDLLCDDTIKLVSLFGPAGTGKTFLALLAGLHKVLVEDAYKKILVSRPVIPLGRDIGYLPGDIEEKLYSWMLPIYDNAELIMHTANIGKHLEGVAQEQSGDSEGYEELGEYQDRRERYRKHDKRRKSPRKRDSNRVPSIRELAHQGKISLEAITYMRGRSIPYQFIIIDEVQNLTPHEVKTIVSRASEGSKVVLLGDPYQIDSPYLDFSSNGLITTTQRFKGQNLFGTVYLETSERSELSKLVTELL